jgi:hypothetical protein
MAQAHALGISKGDLAVQALDRLPDFSVQIPSG